MTENPLNIDNRFEDPEDPARVVRRVRFKFSVWKGQLSQVDEQYVRAKIMSGEGTLGARVAKAVLDEGQEFFGNMDPPINTGALGFRDYLYEQLSIGFTQSSYRG